MSEDNKIRLKPVVFTTKTFRRGDKNTSQQMFLLKALQVSQDPKKLKDLIGVKTVAEVYRTLDKLAMRKEYHEALSRKGISFDYITQGIKEIADCGEKDADRLKAFQTLLKSLGMEKYDIENSGTSGTWEEELIKKIESEKEGTCEQVKIDEYSVVFPKIPEKEKILEEEELDATGSIYDTK